MSRTNRRTSRTSRSARAPAPGRGRRRRRGTCAGSPRSTPTVRARAHPHLAAARRRPPRRSSSSTKPSPPHCGHTHSRLVGPRSLIRSAARVDRQAARPERLAAGDARELRIAARGRSARRRPVGPLRCLAMMMSATPGLLGLVVVVLLAVDEHHEVGVLLDLAALAKVREQRALVVAGRCSGARLSCETAITGTFSSRARIFSPRLIWPTCSTRLSRGPVGAHQLQVVDDDQAEAAAAARAPCACRRRAFARSSRMSMSEESSIQSGACSSASQALITFGQSSAATWPLRSLSPGHPRLAGDEALGELGLGHLEREQRDRLACP